MSIRFAAAAALFLMAGLSGCSKLKLGYEYADWFVVYSVEENFDLDKAQRNHLKGEVEGYFAWHRKEMLPRYAEFLAYVAGNLKNGLRPAEIDSGYARYRVLYHATLEPVAAKAAVMLHALAPGQIEAWHEKQRKKNQKLRKEFSGSPGERLENRGRKILEELEDWTGRLTREQRKKIETLNGALPWNGEIWLETREAMQNQLTDALKQRAPVERVRGTLETYMLNPDSLRTREQRLQLRETDSRQHAFILAVHNLLTPGQRKHFIRQVEKLAADLRALSAQD